VGGNLICGGCSTSCIESWGAISTVRFSSRLYDRLLACRGFPLGFPFEGFRFLCKARIVRQAVSLSGFSVGCTHFVRNARNRRQADSLSYIDSLRQRSIFSIQMRRGLIIVVLLLAMLSSAIGTVAHEAENSCPIPNLPACCKKAQSRENSPAASITKLCCKLNCGESGTTGSSSSTGFSSQPGATVDSASLPLTTSELHDFARRFHTPHISLDSHPKYIRHLALLI